MLKPMIDNMQQTAMASYGDYGAMGLAAKPNLPPINPKFDVALSADDTPISQSQSETAKVDVPEEIPEHKDNFAELVAKRENEATKALKLPIMRQELSPKISCDAENAQLYVAMMAAQSQEANPRQDEVLSALAQLVGQRGKGAAMNEEHLVVLDEALLMSAAAQLFAAVSLLRLLLVLPAVAMRYSADLMIVHQVLYKVGIEFESEAEAEGDEKEAEAMDDADMNATDAHQLQFAALCAVSHLFLGRGAGAVELDEGLVNLGINALRSADANVRLAAARLLFNVLREAKRQALQLLLLTDDDEDEDAALLATRKRIYAALLARCDRETHVPARFRMLCCFALACFAEEEEAMRAMGCDKDKLLRLVKGKSDGNLHIDALKAEILSVLDVM